MSAAKVQVPVNMFGKPLLRSVVSVGTLMFAGDAIAQQLEDSSASHTTVGPDDRILSLPTWREAQNGRARRQWNLSRSVRMGAIGVISAGPLSHGTYMLCARVFPGTAWRPVLKKVALVVVLAPVQISSTFSLVVVLAGGTLTECKVRPPTRPLTHPLTHSPTPHSPTHPLTTHPPRPTTHQPIHRRRLHVRPPGTPYSGSQHGLQSIAASDTAVTTLFLVCLGSSTAVCTRARSTEI